MWTSILIVWTLLLVSLTARKLFQRDPPRLLTEAEIVGGMLAWPRGWMGRK